MKIIRFIDKGVKLLWIFLVVSIAWQLLEIVMIGHINSNNVDTIIAIILSLSLYQNIKNQKWFKGE